MSKLKLAIAFTALASVALTPAAAHAAKSGAFSGSLGVTVKKGSSASVRAINLSNRTVVAGKDLSRTGKFSLSLPAGSYLVVGTVVNKKGKAVRKQLGLSLKSGQKRKNAKLTAKLRAKGEAKAKASFQTESGNSSPGKTAVGVYPFKGPTSGDLKYAAQGAADLMIVDLLNSLPKACKGTGGDVVIREVDPERVKALRAEQELGRSPYADKSTFPTPNVIVPDVSVNGTVGADGKVTVTVTDARTGEVLDTATQSLGDDAFGNLEKLSGEVAKKLCKLVDAFELKLNVTGDSIAGTHNATGTLNTTLIARGTNGQWTGSGPFQWTNISFTSKVGCPLYNPVSIATQWTAKITQTVQDQISITWSVVGSDLATGTIDCPPDDEDDYDPPPIPGLPAVSLMTAGPGTFTLPLSGGSQTISGGINTGSDGFFNNGTMTVRPITTKR